MAVTRDYRVFAWLTLTAHSVVAVCLALEPAAGKITNAHLMGMPHPWAAYTLACVVAYVGLRQRQVSVLWLWPQQVLIFMAAIGAVVAVAQGRYPDNYAPPIDEPRLFILADQVLYIGWAIAHYILEIRGRS